MSDPRRHRAEAPHWPARDASAGRVHEGASWAMAKERATHPELVHAFAGHPRRRILDAFVWTVAREGYANTPLERVLELARVPEPVFQEHFENKQDCMTAALEELVEGTWHVVLRQIATRELWSEQVRLALRTLLDAMARHPDGARLAFVEYLSAGERPVARMRAAAASLVPAMERGRAQGEDTAHLPVQASEAIVGGIASILHRHVLNGRTAELPGLLGDITYFALVPYLGHERALHASESPDPTEP
jgi:AcrR family transcriptional regulator